jgi:PilZ domain
MHLNKSVGPERLERVRSRESTAAPGISYPIIELPNRSPMVDRCLPAGSAAICGRWADKPAGRRGSQRVRVLNAEIGMRRMGSFSFQVVLEDISTGGCKVELVDFVEVNDHVIARFPGIEPFSAKVSWADSRSAGIDFDRPLHPAVFEQLLSRL